MDLKTQISVVENMLEQASKLSNVKSLKRIIKEISNFQLPFPMRHYNDYNDFAMAYFTTTLFLCAKFSAI